MSTAIQKMDTASLATLDQSTMLALVSGGDCSKLTPAQKTAYYTARCEAAGLDPRAQPFAFTKLSGKEVLYALKAAADQLAAKHGVKLTITDQRTEDGIRVVTVRAEARDGRVTEEIGALNIKGISGEALANALMKCVTKAKRRAVLSLCGLGMLDETEVESIPHAAPAAAPVVALPSQPKPAPRPEPVVEVEPQPEPEHEVKARAEGLVAAAEALGGEIVPAAPFTQTKEQVSRSRALWKRAKDALNLEWAAFMTLAAEAIGEKRGPETWSDSDMNDIEAEIARRDDIPF